MASKIPILGGQDCNFVDEPPDSLKCLICTLVVKEPFQHGECGRVFCRICMEEYKRVKNMCPNCRARKPILFKDGRSEKDVRALQVRCSNHCEEDSSSTCEWTGELGDLKYHCLTCPLELQPCPNHCTKDGQEVSVIRKYIQKHLEEECLNRFYKCPYCKEEGTFLELTVAHVEKCTKMPTNCPNTPCTFVATRSEMDSHKKTECLYAAATCYHGDVGCSVELTRKELVEHEMDNELHLKTAKATIAALRRHLEQTREGVSKLELKMKGEMVKAVEKVHMLKNGQTTFKMPNFSTHKTKHTEFRSPPFYTGLSGYRMCVIVEVNGASKAKGAYVSIYAHLMRGEHDNNLPWPLVGTVTFELLNQLGNHSHRQQSCSFPPDDKDNHRVIDKEIASTGYGCPKFISHTKLGVGGSQESPKDVQYLKNDVLYLRVAVEAPDPINHDWLRCY